MARAPPPVDTVAVDVKFPLPEFIRMETLAEPKFADARSRSPSRSQSPLTIPLGPLPTRGVKGLSKDPVPSFLKMEILSVPELAVARSRSPSPSQSPAVMEYGFVDIPTLIDAPSENCPLPVGTATLKLHVKGWGRFTPPVSAIPVVRMAVTCSPVRKVPVGAKLAIRVPLS